MSAYLGYTPFGFFRTSRLASGFSVMAPRPLLVESPLVGHLSPNSPTFRGPSNWVNLFAYIISSTTLAKIRQNRHFRQIRQHFGTLLAELISSLISSKTLAKFRQNYHFRQNRHFRQIRQHFGTLLAELISSLISSKTLGNFVRIATFTVFAKFANISGPSS